MKYRNVCFAVILHSITQNAPAQVNQNYQKAQLSLNALDNRIKKASQVSASLNYTNEVVYGGRDFGIQQFSLSPGITYRHRSGFWTAASASYFSGISQKLGKADAVVGYSTRLDERLSASFAYAKWFYFGKSASELKFAYDHFLSAYWTIQVGGFGVSPQAYYLIRKTGNMTQVGLTISKYIEIKHFINDKDKIMINPTATAILATKLKNPVSSDVYQGKTLRIINYQVTLPVTYRRVGKFDITPTLLLTAPVNFRPSDGTHTKPFLHFNLHGKYLLWRD